jgi:hypothetical protein
MATTYSLSKNVSLVEYLEAFHSHAEVRSWDWKKIASSKTTKRKTEQMFPFAMLGQASYTQEGEPFYRADMAELPAVTFTMKKYTISSSLTYEAAIYDNHIKDLAGKLGKSMGRSLAYAKDKALADILNEGFSSTNYPMYDSAALCDAHTTRAGNTVDNDLGPSSMTYDTVWDMVDYMRTSIYNHEGMLASQSGKYFLLTKDSNERYVKKILEAKGEPDTAFTNNPNALPTITPLYVPFLSSSTAFFIVNDDFKDDFIVFDVDQPKYDTQDDKVRHGTLYLAWRIFGFNVKDYFNIVGNPGA